MVAKKIAAQQHDSDFCLSSLSNQDGPSKMPELPEVETMVRGIRDTMIGRTIRELCRCPCRCRPLTLSPKFAEMSRRVVGTRVIDVRRIAKRVVIDLSSHESFIIEPRMTGLMLLSDPPDVEHLRLEWRMVVGRKTESVWFWDRRGLGVVRLCDADELSARLGRGSLGIDALALTLSDWSEVCAGTSRPIKVALLDQKLVAGIGNLYASEILHRARISPTRPSDSLNQKQIARLSESSLHVLHDAIRHEGSTLSDGTYRNALNQNGGYQNAHRVYDREGLACFKCGSKIVRIVQAQRSTFYCRRCQR